MISELTAFTGDDKKDEHDDIADNLSYAVECHQQGPTSRSGGAPGVWLPKGLRLWAAGGR